MSDTELILVEEDGGWNEVVVAKAVAMATLFCASMLCGLLPMLLARKLKWFSESEAGDLKTSNRVVMSLLAFGGGVLFATTFLHVMPEVQENVAVLECLGTLQELDFDLGALLACIGFFIMYLVEELVHMYIHYKEKQNGKTQPLSRNLSIRASNHANHKSISTSELIEPDFTKPEKHMSPESGMPQHAHSHGHSHMPVMSGQADDVTNALRGLLVVLALSIHELFEGLAVGLESSAQSVWYMLGAIAAHKLVIAFCIGVELLALGTKTWLAGLYILTFAIVSPLGIGFGLLLVGGEGATGAGLVSVVLQGLASGTLMYVIFFEIWRNDRTGILQYIASLVGFAIMFGLMLLTPHAHSHGECSSHSHDDDDHGHSHGA